MSTVDPGSVMPAPAAARVRVEVGFYGKLPSHGDFLARRTLDGFVGAYKRRAGQSPELMGILDTLFDIQDLAVLRTPDGLELQVKGKRRPLKPVSSHRFVVPDAYIPAGTLQIAFNRGAMRDVRSLTFIAGGGALVFDKKSMQGQESD